MTESLTEAIKTMLTEFLTEQKATKILTAFQTKKVQNQLRELIEQFSAKPKKLKDPSAPKRPLTAYMAFTAWYRKNHADELPAKNQMSHIAKQWAECDDETRAMCEKEAKESKDKYKIAIEAYVKPDEEELKALPENNKKPRKPRKPRAPKDPNAIAKNQSAYLFFCKEMRPRAKANVNGDQKMVMKELGRMWNQDYGKDEQRVKWVKEAEKDKARYEAQKGVKVESPRPKSPEPKAMITTTNTIINCSNLSNVTQVDGKKVNKVPAAKPKPSRTKKTLKVAFADEEKKEEKKQAKTAEPDDEYEDITLPARPTLEYEEVTGPHSSKTLDPKEGVIFKKSISMGELDYPHTDLEEGVIPMFQGVKSAVLVGPFDRYHAGLEFKVSTKAKAGLTYEDVFKAVKEQYSYHVLPKQLEAFMASSGMLKSDMPDLIKAFKEKKTMLSGAYGAIEKLVWVGLKKDGDKVIMLMDS
jgi:hypothetical protein